MLEPGPPLTVTIALACTTPDAFTALTVSTGIAAAVPPSVDVNVFVRSVGYAFGTSAVVAVEYIPFEARTRAVYCTFGTTGSPARVGTVSWPPVKENVCVPREEPMVALAVPVY